MKHPYLDLLTRAVIRDSAWLDDHTQATYPTHVTSTLTRSSSHFGLMEGHRLRRWPYITPQARYHMSCHQTSTLDERTQTPTVTEEQVEITQWAHDVVIRR